MKLTKISNNFTPINEGIFFGIDTETDEPTDLTVEIVDARNGQIVATQLLRSVTYAEVNIAPYVEQFSAYQPSTHKFATIVEAPTASYYIRIGSELSESIILSVNQTAPTKSSIVSSMPNTRRISYGEGDELLLLVDAGDTLTVDITTDMGDGSSLEYITERGVASLFISTKEFSEETHSINVEIARNGELLGIALLYHLGHEHTGNTRSVSNSGTGNACENHGSENVDVGKAAIDMAYYGIAEVHKSVGNAALGHGVACKGIEGDSQKSPAVYTLKHTLTDGNKVATAEEKDTAHCGQTQRNTDGDTQNHHYGETNK